MTYSTPHRSVVVLTSPGDGQDHNSESGPLIDKTKIPSSLEPHFSHPDKVVKFIIGTGENKKTFIVHQDVAYKVPIFYSALNAESENPFHESEKQEYTLEDIQEQVFGLFVQFLYRGSCQVIQLKPYWAAWSEDNELADSIAREENLNLVELWILGDRLCYASIQEWVLATAASLIDVKCDLMFDLLERAYNNAIDNSDLRQFAIEQAASKLTIGEIKSARGKLSNDLLLDLTLLELNKRDNEDAKAETKSFASFVPSFRSGPLPSQAPQSRAPSIRSNQPGRLRRPSSLHDERSTWSIDSPHPESSNNRPASGVMNTVGTALRRMKSKSKTIFRR
ncbi:uncharacterized protein PAC_01055 [Phialocephala subalpina]|uniref:BTB domain-containing protein n=1 Tax=Phialocephala subalpina TaxID=576137 RepID=A0A1L7WEG6_9HELO|nr:uncharacterized protein PAC_01055 [Phialocephala subalpina]